MVVSFPASSQKPVSATWGNFKTSVLSRFCGLIWRHSHHFILCFPGGDVGRHVERRNRICSKSPFTSCQVCVEMEMKRCWIQVWPLGTAGHPLCFSQGCRLASRWRACLRACGIFLPGEACPSLLAASDGVSPEQELEYNYGPRGSPIPYSSF